MGSPHGADPEPAPVVVVPEPSVPEPEPEVPEPVPVAPEPVAEVEEEEEEDTGDVPVSRSSALIEESLNATLEHADLD